MVLVLVSVPAASAECLTSTQITAISSLIGNLSVTDQFLLMNLFESFCISANGSVSRDYIDLKLEAFTDDYNDTMNDVNQTINDFNDTMEDRMEDQLRVKFSNYTEYIQEKLDLVDAMNSLAEIVEVDSRITQVKADIKADYNQEIESIERMLDDMEEEFIVKADLDNITSQLRLSASSDSSQPYSRADYTMYYFFGFIGTMVLLAFAYSKGWLRKVLMQKPPAPPGTYGASGDVSQISFKPMYKESQRDMKEDPDYLRYLEEKKGIQKKQLQDKLKDDVKRTIKVIKEEGE